MFTASCTGKQAGLVYHGGNVIVTAAAWLVKLYVLTWRTALDVCFSPAGELLGAWGASVLTTTTEHCALNKQSSEVLYSGDVD